LTTGVEGQPEEESAEDASHHGIQLNQGAAILALWVYTPRVVTLYRA